MRVRRLLSLPGGRWLVAALDLVFPALCPLCDAPLGERRRDPICGPCWARLPRLDRPWCDRCGLPIPALASAADPDSPSPSHPGSSDVGSSARGLCQRCTEEPPTFAYARAAARYDGPVREAIHALKFRGKRALARALAELVLEQLATELAPDVEALVPVPLARARERQRGFNQAALIAERLGRHLGIPVELRWLTRTRSTQPQTDLTSAERRANVRGAFAAADAVEGRHVVVVDDVLTTGATVDECSRALHAAGARRVGVVAVARAL